MDEREWPSKQEAQIIKTKERGVYQSPLSNNLSSDLTPALLNL